MLKNTKVEIKSIKGYIKYEILLHLKAISELLDKLEEKKD